VSKQLLLRIILTTGFGLVTGFLTMHLIYKNNSTRRLASISESPLLIQKLSQDMVSRNFFQLKLSSEEIAENQNGISVIKATITAFQNMPSGLKYTWYLEKDATTTSVLEGTLPAISAGQTYDLQINVSKFSKEIQNHITFSVSGKIAEHTVLRDAIIATRPEDSFEYVLQKAAEERKQDPQNMKIQKLSNGQKIDDKFRLDKIIR